MAFAFGMGRRGPSRLHQHRMGRRLWVSKVHVWLHIYSWYVTYFMECKETTFNCNFINKNGISSDDRSLQKKLMWSKYMLIKDTYSIKLLCDNQSNINLVNNPIFHYRTKHVKLQYHFIIKENGWKSHWPSIYIPTNQ